jgi:hypothetical protein
MTLRSPPAAPRRLVEREDAVPGSDEAMVIALLKGQKPYRLPAGRRQRVSNGLARKVRRHTAPALLRPAIVLGMVVICGGAFASAQVFGWTHWLIERCEGLVSTVAPAAKPPIPPPAVTPSVARPSSLDVLAPEPRPYPASAPLERRLAPPASLRRRPQGRVHDSVSAAVAEDDSPVLAAVRALRRERDPVRARALLTPYLAEHPDGTLAQEALAISIEAAVAHHDPDASSLAAQYLRRYPSGPFSALARQTLSAATGTRGGP